MIPLSTPPGTEIVCIKTPCKSYETGMASPISKGELHLLKRWGSSPADPTQRFVVLEGLPNTMGFYRGYFRLLEKPAELYSLLDRAPVDMETV